TIAAMTLVASIRGANQLPVLRWSVVGAVIVFAGALIDRIPWAPAVSELRYVHPFYALAWLGLGALLRGVQLWRMPPTTRRLALSWFVGGLALLTPLLWAQLRYGHAGWLHPDAEMLRLSSLVETSVSVSLFDWITHADGRTVLLVLLPIISALITAGVLLVRRDTTSAALRQRLTPSAVALAVVFVVSVFKLRWSVVALALSFPVGIVLLTGLTQTWR